MRQMRIIKVSDLRPRNNLKNLLALTCLSYRIGLSMSRAIFMEFLKCLVNMINVNAVIERNNQLKIVKNVI